MNRGITVFLLALMVLGVSACSKVPSGYRGVKVYLLGGSKGVDVEELGVGRYWIGINEDLYLFPVFTQNQIWTKEATEGSPNDDSISFQDKDGLVISTDIGLSYHIAENKVASVFQKYRKGVDEITAIYLRNMVRDAFVIEAGKMGVQDIYGSKKGELLENVEARVKKQVEDIGIIIERIYLVGDMRLPGTVMAALNAKITATQNAQARENELREAEAAAKKVIAAADGDAKARMLKAKAEAEANRIVAASITPELVRYETVKRWDGVLPKFAGGGVVPMLDVAAEK